MVLPLGRVMVIGLIAGCLLMTGAPLTTKCPVAPESEIVNATLATNLLVDTLCQSTFSFLNNAHSALCRVGDVMASLLMLSILTSGLGGCSSTVLSKLLLQFDIRAVASSSSSSSLSYINAAY